MQIKQNNQKIYFTIRVLLLVVCLSLATYTQAQGPGSTGIDTNPDHTTGAGGGTGGGGTGGGGTGGGGTGGGGTGGGGTGGGGTGGGASNVPLDGGLSILLASTLGYGAKKLREHRKRNVSVSLGE